MEDIIIGIKSIKYLNCENLFIQKILKIRNEEFKGIKGVEYGDTFITFFRRITNSLLLFVILKQAQNLQFLNIYTTLTLLDKFVTPFNTIPWCLGAIFGSLASIKHILAFMSQVQVEKLQEENSPQGKNIIEINQINVYWPQQPKIKLFPLNQGKNSFQNQIPVLQSIDLQLKQGQISFIYGQVGVGKTALIDLILNELKVQILSKNQSKFSIRGKISYVPQNPWIFDGTIRENILFGSEFDKQRYIQSLKLSQLIEDLQSFSEKDLKEAGQNGQNLSGGQKQRLAICRALYQNSDIYLFDDILSSLDEQVADNLMNQAIFFYLKSQNKCIVQTINQYKYLPFADQIIQIEKNKKFTIQQNSAPKLSGKHMILNKDVINISENDPKQDLEKFAQNFEENIEKTKNLKENFNFYISTIGISQFVLFILCSILEEISKGIYEFWSFTYIQSEVDQSKKPIFLFYDQKVLTLVILFVFLSIFNFSRSWLKTYIQLKASKQIFSKILNATIFSKISLYDKNPPGYIIEKLFFDVKRLDSINLNSFLMQILDFILLSTILCYEVKSMSIILIIGLFLIYKLENFEKNHLKNWKNQKKNFLKNKKQDLVSFIMEVTSGVKTIRAFKKENSYKRKFNEILLRQHQKQLINEYQKFFPTMINKSIEILCYISVVIVAIYQIKYHNVYFLPEQYCLALTYSFRITEKLKQTVNSRKKLLLINQILYKTKNYIENVAKPEEFTEISTNIQKIQNISKVEIQFLGVCLQYNQNNYALQNLSFQIKKGQKIAICGRTGSGKSSIFNCLVRLYDISAGSISIQGQNILGIGIQKLRAMMNIIPQNGFLFKGTLKENLDLKNIVSKQEIEEFLIENGIKFDNLSKSNQNQTLDIDRVQIEKSGNNLSNGEKQIVNFVQNMINSLKEDKKIILLDEATSNLDPKTDQIIMNILFKLTKNKTLIMISHRLDNLKQFDKIIVLSKGQIVEEGSFVELRSKKNSVFNQLSCNED